jgi:hypothetical protein
MSSDRNSSAILQKPLRCYSHAKVQPRSEVPHGDSLVIETISPYSGHGLSISCFQATADLKPTLVFLIVEISLRGSCDDENVGFLTSSYPITSYRRLSERSVN